MDQYRSGKAGPEKNIRNMRWTNLVDKRLVVCSFGSKLEYLAAKHDPVAVVNVAEGREGLRNGSEATADGYTRSTSMIGLTARPGTAGPPTG